MPSMSKADLRDLLDMAKINLMSDERIYLFVAAAIARLSVGRTPRFGGKEGGDFLEEIIRNPNTGSYKKFLEKKKADVPPRFDATAG